MIISSLNTIPNVRNYKTFNKNNKSSSIKNQKHGNKDILNIYPSPYIQNFGASKLSKEEKEINSFAKDHHISIEDSRKYFDKITREEHSFIFNEMPSGYTYGKRLEGIIHDEEMNIDRLRRIAEIDRETNLLPPLAMALEKLEHNLEKNIQRLADELNISPEDAKVYNDFYLPIASINPTGNRNEVGLNAIKGYGQEKVDLAINFVTPIVAQERKINFRNSNYLEYHSPYIIFKNKHYIRDNSIYIDEEDVWDPIDWAVPNMKVPSWNVSSTKLDDSLDDDKKDWPVPSFTILFGPEGSGKTYMVDKACEHLQQFGVNVESIKFSANNHEENCKKIRETYINGYERFKETGKYTVIKFEDDLEDYPTELKEIAGICNTISDREGTDIYSDEIGVFSIGTTTNLNNVKVSSAYSIPIGVMKDFNAGEMLKFSLMKHGERKSAEELDCKKINEIIKEDLITLTPAEIELIVELAQSHKIIPEQRITAESILNEMHQYEQSGRATLTPNVRRTFRKDRTFSKKTNTTHTFSNKIKEHYTVKDDIDNIVSTIKYTNNDWYERQLLDMLEMAEYSRDDLPRQNGSLLLFRSN